MVTMTDCGATACGQNISTRAMSVGNIRAQTAAMTAIQNGADVRLIVAVPVFPPSIAVTVTDLESTMGQGARYSPLSDIAPLLGLRLHLRVVPSAVNTCFSPELSVVLEG